MNEKQLRSELDAVYGSTSWRMTAPFRWVSSLVRRYIVRFLFPRRWLSVLISAVLQRPKLVFFIQGFLFRFPRLRERIRRLYYRSRQVQTVQSIPSHDKEGDLVVSLRLSHTAQRLYQELRNAVRCEA